MELKDINYNVSDNEINLISYNFSVGEQQDTETTKNETKEKLSEIEQLIEKTYGKGKFEKQPTNRLTPYEIEAGFKYEDLTLKKGHLQPNTTTTITYNMQTDLNRQPNIELTTVGENQEIHLNIYDKIKKLPQLNIEQEAQKNIDQLEYILQGGYKNTKYPGLIN